MEKVYKTSRILAYVLVAIALLGIAPVINGALRDGIEQKYNLDVHSQDVKVWQENWDTYTAECDSNTTLQIFAAISTVLSYLSIICIYGGLFLFFLLLKKNMAKGSRLTPTIILGLAAAILCVVSYVFGQMTIRYFWEVWSGAYSWHNLLTLVCILALIATFATMMRFLPHGTMRLSCIILTILIVATGIQYLFYLIGGRIGQIIVVILFPLAFAYFYYEFSKLKKQTFVEDTNNPFEEALTTACIKHDTKKEVQLDVKPNDYLVWSILVTVFCFIPMGIAAIVFSARVDNAWHRGDKEYAHEMAQKAKKFCWISLGIAITLGIIIGIIVGLT